MVVMRRRRVACLLVFATIAGQVTAAEPDYPAVRPGRVLTFPQDAGSHPEYRIEWWYVTGWLAAPGTAPTGFQLTFFRVRPGLGENNPSRFAPRQLLFAHAAVADPATGRLRHAERSARAGFDLAYAREGRMDVRIDEWRLRELQDGAMEAVASGEDFGMRLALRPTQPVLLQGEAGFSRKGPEPPYASYYYSQPQLEATGELVIDGVRHAASGGAWLDHEWSSEPLDFEARGWDWTGINLDDGGALMAFRTRDAQGRARWGGATLRSATGELRTFGPEEVEWSAERHWQSPRTGVRYTVAWRLRVGGEEFRLESLFDDAELDSRGSTGTIYWEGPATLLDRGGRPLGRGYLELTGY